MIDVNKIASYIYNRYNAEYNEKISEMKLHKGSPVKTCGLGIDLH